MVGVRTQGVGLGVNNCVPHRAEEFKDQGFLVQSSPELDFY